LQQQKVEHAMARTIVFDVNETLLNVGALQPLFVEVLGEKCALKEWFSLLLLHSEVATIAGPYFDFATIARAALQMTAAVRNVKLTTPQENRILEAMSSLPAHPEVAGALQSLQSAGLQLVALTNSSARVLSAQMKNSGLAEYFHRNFSVDEIHRFKPAPEVYQMVATELGLETRQLRMVAAHAWDIVGAMQAGCAGAFIARPGKVLFPLVAPPDIIGPDLTSVAARIVEMEA
jgi:2-haloacid dehalogenase